MNYKKYPIIAGLILSMLISCLCPLSAKAEEEVQEIVIDYNALAMERRSLPVASNEWEGWPNGPLIGAEGAILMEASTGTILYAKNIHEHLYPASITKILAALVAAELGSLTDPITYSAAAISSINWRTDSNIQMQPGEELTLEQSLYGLLVGSANEVANALAENLTGDVGSFVAKMNEKAKELGCQDSHFVTANGIFDENHYTSVYDMARIANAFFSNDVLARISGTATYKINAGGKLRHTIDISSKNQLYEGRTYAYPPLIGSKTGFTSEARQTLVSCAEQNGMRLICVVMKEEAPYQYLDTTRLFDYGFENFHLVNAAENDTRYTTGSDNFYNFGTDLLGNSSPILNMDPDAQLVLPTAALYNDTESVITADPEDPDSLAYIQYTYCGNPVGTARISLNMEVLEGKANAPVGPRKIYLNVIPLTVSLTILLVLLFSGILLFSYLTQTVFSNRWRKSQALKNARKAARTNGQSIPARGPKPRKTLKKRVDTRSGRALRK